MATPFRLYNTLSRSIEPFEPITDGKVGLYVCGMTVYDDIHMGHARAMVVFDTFVRYLRHRGWDVHFVRNFTDVDDKIIARANEHGEDPLVWAHRYIDRFHEDTDALGLLRADDEPRVSGCIHDIQKLTQDLIDRGHAYISEGNVWFAVKSDAEYGKLSGQKVDELRSADTDAGKQNAADFALWKSVKPGEPSWDSPWGPGRPGWHIECSAMSKKHLGNTFDIHGGGLDLVFPHHENEVAQSECGNAAPYARYWMHNGMLTMDSGQKMGKSLGNVFNVRNALSHFPAEALRLYYAQGLYRSSLPWSDQALPDALSMLGRLYDAREKAEAMGGSESAEQVARDLGEDAQLVLELGRNFPERFYDALDNDFNTAKAMADLLSLARAINRFAGHKKARKRGGPVVAPALDAFRLVSEAINLMAMSTAEFHAEVKTKRLKALSLSAEWVEARLDERKAARDAKDWQLSDAIRGELEQRGIMVMDTPTGAQWRVRLGTASD